MRVTIRDIAKELKLSHATVSFALNNRRDVSIPDVTRQRVKDTAERMGYRPNRAAVALARGESDLVAFWVPSQTLSDYWQLAEAIESFSSERGKQLVIRRVPIDDDSNSAIDLEDWPVAATILLDCGQVSWISSAAKLEHPVVAIGAITSHRLDSVTFDLARGAELAAEEFVRRGVRNVLHMTLADPCDPFEFRRKFVLDAMQGSGLEVQSLLCVDSSPAGIREVLRNKCEKDGVPAAILADTDMAALSCLRTLAELEDPERRFCQVIGFGGSPLGELSSPSLTSVSFSAVDAVEKAWTLIAQRKLEPSRSPIHVKVSPRLLVRESTMVKRLK